MTNVVVRRLTIEDHDETKLLLKNYLETEIIRKYMNWTENDKLIFLKVFLSVIDKNLSAGFFNTKTNEICGLIVLSCQDYFESKEYKNLIKNVSLNCQAVLRFDTCLESDIVKLFNGKIIFMELIYLKPKYRKRNLLFKAIKWHNKIALEVKCDALVALTYSQHQEKWLLKDGFISYKTVRYSEYVDPVSNKAIFYNLPSTHVRAMLLVKPFVSSSL